MNKKTLFPSLIIIFTVALVLFADDSLFEGILMTERLLITNTVNRSSAIFQAGNSVESPDGYQMTAFGTNGIGRLKLKVRNASGVEHASMSASSVDLNIFRVMGITQVEFAHNATDIVMGVSAGDFQLNSDALVFGSGKMDIGASGSPSMRMLSNGVTSNMFGFTEMNTITASNFVATATPAQWSTGTNLSFNLIVGSGNGVATVQATNTFFTGFINAPTNSASVGKTVTLVTANQILTNNTGGRQYVSLSVALIPAVAGTATARLINLAPVALTNCTASIPANADGLARIIPMTAMISPGSIYVLSNYSTGAGATIGISNSNFTSF